MALPEEVDEINAYLLARKKKQELGEIPRDDLAPTFVKNIRGALFGKKDVPKSLLQSTSSTSVSPQAKDAVRQQLDEIMREKEKQPVFSPPTKKQTIRQESTSLPPLPTFPHAAAWKESLPPQTIFPSREKKPSPIDNRSSNTIQEKMPYEDIPSIGNIPSNERSIRAFKPISPITQSMEKVSSAPPSLERTPYMPPWVARQIPKKENPIPSTPAISKPVSSTTPSYSSMTPVARPSTSRPVKSTRPVSGEVRADELTYPHNIQEKEEYSSKGVQEELTEEEAIKQLPFEEVQGLSPSELAYLERKEKEHAQLGEEKIDQGDMNALRAHLKKQESQITQSEKKYSASQSAPLSNEEIPPQQGEEDPKKAILRRLKEMIEEEGDED
ncbi:MAG: hypothetical protein V1776_04210 [Candidatus Diapherotrites archaeon]